MKKMMKVAAMLAAVVLLFGAIGCSGDDSEGSSPPSPPPIYGDGDNEDNEQSSQKFEYDHDIWDMEYADIGYPNVTKYKGSQIEVTIPDGVVKIMASAFQGNSTLTYVHIPKSVKYIEKFAFKGCTRLSAVYYDGTAEEWGEIGIEAHRSLGFPSNTLVYGNDGSAWSHSNSVYDIEL